MTYRYPKHLAYLEFGIALVMGVALYVSTQPKFWGWLLFAPLFLAIVIEGVRTYRYSLTVVGDSILIDGFKHAQYLVSRITAINVWVAKGERIAVITFADQKKLSVPSHLEGFNELVESLRKQTHLAKPSWEP